MRRLTWGGSRRRLAYLLVGIQVVILAAIVASQELNRALDTGPGVELEIPEAHARKDPFRGASVGGQVALSLEGGLAEVVGGPLTPGERVLVFFASDAGRPPRPFRVERPRWGADPVFTVDTFNLPGRVLPDSGRGYGSRHGPVVSVGKPAVSVELDLPQSIPIADTLLDHLTGPSLLRVSLKRGAFGHRYLSGVMLAGQRLSFPMSFTYDSARDQLIVIAPKGERIDRRPFHRERPPQTSLLVFDGAGKEVRLADAPGLILEGAVGSSGGALIVLLGQERYGGSVHLAELREDGTVIRRGPEILSDRVLGFEPGTSSAWVITGTPAAYPQPPFFIQRMTLDGLTGPRVGPFVARPRGVVAVDRGLWVVESDQHRVTHLDIGGARVREYRDLNRPTEIAVDRGSLMVVEAGQTQLTRFGPDGTTAWRLPRFQGLAWIVPDPETGGGWVGAMRYENAEGGVFRYEADGRIARLPVAISPRLHGDGIRNRLTPDAIRDRARDRFYICEGQAIAILGGDGTLLRRVQAFRYTTPRPLPN